MSDRGGPSVLFVCNGLLLRLREPDRFTAELPKPARV